MPHAALDVKFHANPKVLSAGKAATGLFCMALSYSADYLTDGFVPGPWANTHGTVRERAKLVEAGLWQKHENGYLIANYLEHNLSREKVRELSDKGRRNADAGWEKRRRKEQEAMQGALGSASKTQSPTPSTDTYPDTDPEAQQQNRAGKETDWVSNGKGDPNAAEEALVADFSRTGF